MGLSFIEKKGKWQGVSSISDEKLLDKPGTKEDIKKVLIEKEIWGFFDKINKIEMEFPHQYHVNDRMVFDNKEDTPRWDRGWLDNVDKENFTELVYEKTIALVEKYELDEYFKPLLNK
jgi:hypothetical protein